MNSLKEALIKEIPVFRELGHKFVNKEVSSGDFKAMSGGMGSYAQRGGQDFMIRLRIPSGIMSMDKFKKVYELAKKQNLDKVHLTTRQAIQLHSLSIDGVCDTMEEALKNDIFTRGGGENFPRNVSISPLSGVDVEEAFDVTPYAEAVNEHFMSKITTYKLPRKLKVSFSSSEKDCGNSTVADLGFLAIKKDNKEYFKVYIGGGIGKNPAKSVEFDSLINPNEILYHVEAITNLFIAEGDYENKNKARIRYIVDRMGEEAFLNCYKEHLNKVFESENLDVNIEYKEYKKQGIKTSITHNRLIPQKQEGLYSVYFHPVCGQLSMSNYKLLIDKLDKLEDIEIRLSMNEGMYIRNLNGEEAVELINLTQNLGGETKLEQSVACIGSNICQIGIADSQGMLEDILKYFKEKNFNDDILPKIRISGCTNSCGTHQMGILGFAGKKKRVNNVVTESFELYLGGEKGKDKTKLGSYIGDITRENVPEFLYELAKSVEESNLTYEEYIVENNEQLNNIIDKYLAEERVVKA